VILELDAGNTRIKWRVIEGANVLARGAVLHTEEWQRQVEIALDSAPARVRVANVAGPDVRQAVVTLAKIRWGVDAELASTDQGVGIVTHRYEQPEKLGVDRWLTLLAARKAHQGVSIIVDAGSAVTLDVVDQCGQHLGGFIVPGLEMQRQALLGATSDVQIQDSKYSLTVALGRDTSRAVINGGVAMVVGMIGLVCEQYVNARLWVSGGDGGALLPFLPSQAEFNGDLVMDGLAVMMP
jgi:type III pantothenate kinase